MIKILTVLRIKPEEIKMPPVTKNLRKHHNEPLCCICVTAQHRRMVDKSLKLGYERMPTTKNPYGDEKAREKIAARFLKESDSQ